MDMIVFTALISLVSASTTRFEGSQFIHGMEAINGSRCGKAIVSTITYMLNDTDVETVFIIHEDIEDSCVYDVIKNLKDNIKLQLMGYSRINFHIKPLLETLVKMENIVDLRRSLNILVICTVECIQTALKMSKHLDEEVGKKSALRHFSRWILISTETNAYIPVSDLKLDNVVLLSEDKTSSLVEVFTLLWKTTGREWGVVDTGTSTSLDSAFPNMKLGLNERKLIVSSLEWLPFSKKETNANTTLYSGLSGDIMEYLSLTRCLNFSYQYVEPPDLLWGHKLENESWTGIVGMMQRVDADMSSVPYAFNIERTEVMSFTYPILIDLAAVIYKKVTDDNKTWKVLVSCFKWEVYAVGGGVMVTVTLTYLFLLSVTPNPTKTLKTMKNRRYTETFLLGIMGPLQQGTKSPPTFNSGQVLFGSWLLFCFVMATVYRGNLMAFLAVDTLAVPFSTIQELADQNVYDVGAPVGSYLSLTIKASEQPVMKALWKKIQHTQNNSPQTGEGDYEYQMKRLQEGHFAYILSSVATDVIMRNTCDFSRINEYFLPSASSMVFPLHSPIAGLFSPQIMTWIETGLYQRYYNKWVPPPKACSDDSVTTGMHPLGIKEFYSCLAACGAGIFLAVLVLLSETFNEFKPTVVKKSRGYDHSKFKNLPVRVNPKNAFNLKVSPVRNKRRQSWSMGTTVKQYETHYCFIYRKTSI